jgi:hypothetical protein
MDSELRAELTELQRGWLEHLQAWERSGSTLKAYATREGLDHRRLYRFKRLLTNKGSYREGEAMRPRFVRAQVGVESEPVGICRVRFRNGCVVELAGDPSGVLREILQTVGSLP